MQLQQLNLFADLPENTQRLWDQFSDTVQQTAVDRLAKAIVKVLLNESQTEGEDDER
jgi:hypothetical protein